MSRARPLRRDSSARFVRCRESSAWLAQACASRTLPPTNCRSRSPSSHRCRRCADVHLPRSQPSAPLAMIGVLRWDQIVDQRLGENELGHQIRTRASHVDSDPTPARPTDEVDRPPELSDELDQIGGVLRRGVVGFFAIPGFRPMMTKAYRDGSILSGERDDRCVWRWIDLEEPQPRVTQNSVHKHDGGPLARVPVRHRVAVNRHGFQWSRYGPLGRDRRRSRTDW